MKRAALAILLGALWVGANEFLRNHVVFAQAWVDHYRALGLTFPADIANGLVWLVWSLVFVGVLYVISRRFGLIATAALGWVLGFVMMWLVIGNLGVLPYGLLWAAVPWSLLEAAGAAFIVRRLAPPRRGVE